MSPQDHPQSPPAEQLLGSFSSGKVGRFFLFPLFFLLLLFILAWLIRYPDVITIRVTLQEVGGVDRYFAAVPGRVAALPVAEGMSVDSGAVLLVWESSGSWEDIIRLSAMETPVSEAGIAAAGRLELGPLEEQWALARGAWAGLQSARRAALAPSLAAPLGRQGVALAEMEAALGRRAETLNREAALAKDLLERTQRLAEQNTVSREALIRSEAEYLRKKADAEAIGLEFQRVSLELAELEKEQLELSNADFRDMDAQQERWETAWRLLQARCGTWMQQNLVVAQRAGTVTYSRPLRPFQWVDEGEPLLAVRATEGAGSRVAKGWLPAAGSGKVAPGAEVQLRLDAFPYETYGFIPATVARVSSLPENESFLVEIEAPDSLISDTGKNLPAGPEMPATARILTSKRRLLDRIFDGIRRL
ncbi:MAG: HlyD family efflux transporter periplasmic adaptor subunit [Saprospiraceae bacterium]